MALYFAYGSNLLSTRLTARCASARVVGRGHAADWRVGFAKYSWMDGSGKATLLEGSGTTAEGVLYEVSVADMDRLDAIEGVGKGYDRVDGLRVEAMGETIGATGYIATDPSEGQRPFDWYLALILAGAREHGLSQAAISNFAAHPYDTDTEHARPGRIAAMEALKAAGHRIEHLLGLVTDRAD